MLDGVADISVTYRAATLQVGAGDLHSVPVSQISRLSDPLLSGLNTLPGANEAVFGRVNNPQNTKTVKLARRQIMLPQKLAKAIWFVSLNIAWAEKLGRMIRTMANARLQ